MVFFLGTGVTIGPGVSFGGIDFHQYKYLDIAGIYVGDVLHITGFYKNQVIRNENDLGTLRSENRNVIIGVLVASVLIVLTTVHGSS